jgi:hypothetical protein
MAAIGRHTPRRKQLYGWTELGLGRLVQVVVGAERKNDRDRAKHAEEHSGRHRTLVPTPRPWRSRLGHIFGKAAE